MAPGDCDETDQYKKLDEVAAPSPVQNPDEQAHYRQSSIEEVGGRDNRMKSNEDMERRIERAFKGAGISEVAAPPPLDRGATNVSSLEANGTPPARSSSLKKAERTTLATKRPSGLLVELYTISYLIFFSFLGTLARLGLQTLTTYPGVPVSTGVLWPNFAGSLVMGFLSEDCRLFRQCEWDLNPPPSDEKMDPNIDLKRKEMSEEELVIKSRQHAKVKKTIPLYIGLATGFCGSFTSFSSFIRDVFLALSNDLPNPSSSTHLSRSGGYSFLAFLAVILLTACLSLSALIFGAHAALALEKWTPSLSFKFTRRVIDPIMVLLAFGCWLAALLIVIFPTIIAWRGEVLFALLFAPLGCLVRFYISLLLNARIPSFPLGTFTVNILGTLCLGMFYDLQHAPTGGVASCQVLQGLMDGFCGCLTTVSTWVAELKGLRRRHAYIYGLASVITGLAGLIVVMGSLRWTRGFAAPLCIT